MKKSDHKRIARRKQKILKRLERPKGLEVGHERMFKGGNVRYEMSGRARSIACGGIGTIHTMVRRLGLPKAIDNALALLKIHAPYFESDHVLTGGTCLEDIVRLRNDETYLDALVIDGVEVEIMGDIQKRLPNGEWKPPVDLARHKRFAEFEDMRIPVLSLEYEYQAYLKLGRADKAKMLKKWLDNSANQEGDSNERR